MNSGLNAPLGKDRKPPRKRTRIFTPGRIFSLVGLLVIGAISIYPSLKSENFKAPEVATTEGQKSQDGTLGQAEDESAIGAPGTLHKARPGDGANIERVTTENGTVVTKYSPRDRSKSGPLIIDAGATGPQDRNSAALPDDALLEISPQGKLPIVAADGTRPVDRYARPWSGARGTRIAIVVGGLGLSQTGTQRALKRLPEEITVAFAANGNSLARWMPEARRGGHEVLLQVPMEPFDYPDNDPGPLTLLNSNSKTKNIDLLHQSMAKITNYTGIVNYLGGRFLADSDALEPVMRDIAERGLLFLDDGSAAQSMSSTYAKALSMPYAFADVVLDQQVSKEAVLTKLDELERIALRKGSAIGISSGFDETVDAISEWSTEAGRRGIEIVGVSALADVPN